MVLILMICLLIKSFFGTFWHFLPQKGGISNKLCSRITYFQGCKNILIQQSSSAHKYILAQSDSMNEKPMKKYEGAATKGENPRIDKIMHMQNFYTKVINEFKVKVEYIAASREINLSGALQQVHSQGLKIENSQIFFENTEMKMYVYMGTFPSEAPAYLKHEFCPDSLIRIKYKKMSDSPKNSNNTQMSKVSSELLKGGSNKNTSANTKERKKERSIGEVVEIVKHWKRIQVDQMGKKVMTLSEAADVVGANKKTLEDYAYQLQFGHEFNFDFEKNKNQGIGVLRSFVKNKRKQMAVINNTDNYFNFESSNSDDDLKTGR